jgi:hypothetical protein
LVPVFFWPHPYLWPPCLSLSSPRTHICGLTCGLAQLIISSLLLYPLPGMVPFLYYLHCLLPQAPSSESPTLLCYTIL